MPLRLDDPLGTFGELVALAPFRAAATGSASRLERSAPRGLGAARMRGGSACAIPHWARVDLGFVEGAGLPDRGALLARTVPSPRHARRARPQDIRRPAVPALLAAARDARARALTPH
jgi:hypothetical protein